MTTGFALGLAILVAGLLILAVAIAVVMWTSDKHNG